MSAASSSDKSATKQKPINPNVFTPEMIIELRKKYPTVGTLFVHQNGKTSQNKRGTTSYTKFKCMGVDGKQHKLVVKFANQLLSKDASPYEGKKDKAENKNDDKKPTNVQLTFRNLSKDELALTDYPESEHDALIDSSNKFMEAMKILNEELEAYQLNHVVNGEDEKIVSSANITFAGIYRASRKLNEEEKKKEKLNGKKPNEINNMKMPLERPLCGLKLSSARDHGIKIGNLEFNSTKFKENVFDLKKIAQFKKDNPGKQLKMIPLTVNGEVLTIDNACKVLTRMSKVSGTFSIDSVSKHGFGISPTITFDTLFVYTHKVIKRGYIDEEDIDGYTEGVSSEDTADDDDGVLVEEPKDVVKKTRAPLLVRGDDDDDVEPVDNLEKPPVKPVKKDAAPKSAANANHKEDTDDADNEDDNANNMNDDTNKDAHSDDDASDKEKDVEPEPVPAPVVTVPKKAAPKAKPKGRAKKAAVKEEDYESDS